jgi:tetratricopeptide (TPR) repeat protein
MLDAVEQSEPATKNSSDVIASVAKQSEGSEIASSLKSPLVRQKSLTIPSKSRGGTRNDKQVVENTQPAVTIARPPIIVGKEREFYESRIRELEVQVKEKDLRLTELQSEKPSITVSGSETVEQYKQDRHLYLYNLGVAYIHAGLFREAAQMFERVLAENPREASAHYNLGILYEEHLDRVEEGIKHYQFYLNYAGDDTKRRQVQDWITVAKKRYGTARSSRTESARKAFEHLFLTAPA